jgi:hypothetical protein
MNDAPHSNWTVPSLWEASACFIIGGGPSLKGFDFSILAVRNVIGCNDAYLLGERVCPICLFGDTAWYVAHQERLSAYQGLKVSCNPDMLGKPDIHVLQREVHRETGRKNVVYGLSTDRRKLMWNGNTGMAAVNLALLLGARLIILLGFDMQLSSSGDPNWHPPLEGRVNPNVYPRFRRSSKGVLGDLHLFPGAKVLNANPESAMDTFPRVTLQEALHASIEWKGVKPPASGVVETPAVAQTVSE